MKFYLLILFFLFVFTGCSTKSPPNNWQYKSAKAFQNYTKYFFEDKQLLANNALKMAISHAKQSADLEQLAHIYLGVCALQRAVGDSLRCEQFENIKELVVIKKLDTYYKMLQKQLSIEDIENLPQEYQEFSHYYLLGKKEEMFRSIEKMEKISSKFIAASLIKNYLDIIEVQYLIQEGSFYGYKKVVLFWLEHLYLLQSDKKEKEKIRKKLEILIER